MTQIPVRVAQGGPLERRWSPRPSVSFRASRMSTSLSACVVRHLPDDESCRCVHKRFCSFAYERVMRAHVGSLDDQYECGQVVTRSLGSRPHVTLILPLWYSAASDGLRASVSAPEPWPHPGPVSVVVLFISVFQGWRPMWCCACVWWVRGCSPRRVSAVDLHRAVPISACVQLPQAHLYYRLTRVFRVCEQKDRWATGHVSAFTCPAIHPSIEAMTAAQNNGDPIARFVHVDT